MLLNTMFEEIAASVWQVQADQPGPSVLLLGGIHGNERTGIKIIETLRDQLQVNPKILLNGTLTLALGNLDAMQQNVRMIDGKDLNRLFRPDWKNRTADGSPEDARMRIIAPLIDACDYLIDIHATNKPSEPFICSLISPAQERLYRWFPAQHVLADPQFILGGEPCTTDDYANLQGKVGLCYEAGWVGDENRLNETQQAIERILIDLSMIAGVSIAAPERKQQAFELTEAIFLTEEGFCYAEGYGTNSFQPVPAGATFGFSGEKPLRAQEDSVIVFPKIKEHWQLGKPVGYLAKQNRPL